MKETNTELDKLKEENSKLQQESKKWKKITTFTSILLIAALCLCCASYFDTSKYDNGYDSGYAEGKSVGYSDGYSDGYITGWDECEEEYNSKSETYNSDENNLYSEDYNTEDGSSAYGGGYSTEYEDNSHSEDYSTETVYVTDTGEKYHRYGCHYLRASCNAISLSDAQNQGYTPCSYCW